MSKVSGNGGNHNAQLLAAQSFYSPVISSGEESEATTVMGPLTPLRRATRGQSAEDSGQRP